MHFKSFVILASSLSALASAAAVDTILNTVTNIPTAGAAAVDTTLNTVTNIPTVIVDGLRKPLDSTTLTFTRIEPTGECTEEEREDIKLYENLIKKLRQKQVAALREKYKGMSVNEVPVKVPGGRNSKDTLCKKELDDLQRTVGPLSSGKNEYFICGPKTCKRNTFDDLMGY
ncbi:hypothetical protein C0992_006570 [Termitomyces sp. T32_za158]|nr:hypothetical protein C0992_006570 [Termitomyces sp. T32_za158]